MNINKLILDFKKYRNEDNVLVYQMGKVGSTSLEKSIPDGIHIHTLYGNSPCYLHQKQRDGFVIGKIKRLIFEFFKRVAINRRNKIKIITLIREPSERNVSMFFQNIQHWLYSYSGKKVDLRSEGMNLIFDAFYEEFDHDYVLDWLDKEIFKFTGIDLYDYDFNSSDYFLRITKGKYEILLVKQERLRDCDKILTEFLGANVELTDDNSSEKKWYGSVYAEFKSMGGVSDSYKNNLRSSKYYKKFYG